MIVLDTGALIYWTLDPDRLSTGAADAIGNAPRILVSSISLWEIAIKVKRGALELPVSVADYVAALHQVERLAVEPVDTAQWLASVALDWAHRDPADRAIVALAMERRCPLVTSDITIRAFYEAAVW